MARVRCKGQIVRHVCVWPVQPAGYKAHLVNLLPASLKRLCQCQTNVMATVTVTEMWWINCLCSNNGCNYITTRAEKEGYPPRENHGVGESLFSDISKIEWSDETQTAYFQI